MRHQRKLIFKKNSRALLAVELPPHLVSNTYAKQILEVPESKESFFVSPRGQSVSGVQVTNQTEETKTGTIKTAQKTRPESKSGLTSSEKKNMGQTVFEGTCIVWKLSAITNTKQFVLW